MTIDTTGSEPPKRPKMAPWEKEAKRKQAAHSKSRSASSASNWDPWSLETHLKNAQLDMVVNGTLPLPPNPKPGSNFPIVRDVHAPLEQVRSFASDTLRSGDIDRVECQRLADILAIKDRSDRISPIERETREALALVFQALAYSGEEDDPLVDFTFDGNDGGDDDGDRKLSEPEPPMTIGPESWPERWDPKDAAEAGQGNIDI